VPYGHELAYNYITSIVSSSQEIVFEYNEEKKFTHLVIDQIHKDHTFKEGFNLTMETNSDE